MERQQRISRLQKDAGTMNSPKEQTEMKHSRSIRTRAAALFLSVLSISIILSGQPSSALTEKELSRLYLDIVEKAVSAFEPIWVDDSKRIHNSGFFDVRKYDDWTPAYKGYAGIVTIPLNGLVDFCYAVLLIETDKPHFTSKKIPRAVLLDHALKSIRWCCLTSVYVKNRYPYIYEDTAPQFLEGQYWRREFGYRADESGFLTLAAAKLWDKLDAETRGLVEEVMIGIAPKERLVRTWEPPQGGNHDQVKQDLSSTIGAAFLFPQRPDQKLYRDIVALNGLDLVSTLHDFACPTIVEGKPVSEWAKGWNLYEDYSSDHHGWAQIWYGSDLIFECYSYVDILSRLYNRRLPETFTYPGNGFEGVMERLKVVCLPEGEPMSVHGMEYDSYYGSGLLAYLYGAVIKKDPVAAGLEERAALLLRRHSRALPAYDYHRNNHAKAAFAYLIHKYGGGRAEPLPFEKAWQALEGTFHHPWWQNLVHRDGRKFASFSWGTISSQGEHFGGAGSGVCGYVVPARLSEAEPEPLVYLHPHSITGEFKAVDGRGQETIGPLPSDLYRFSRDDSRFQTAGRMTSGPVEQRCAFFSFADGPAVFMNMFKARETATLDWSGLPVYFYSRPGVTSSRRYFDADGERRLEEAYKGRSDWWCVNDLLGLAVLGGSGDVEIERTVGRNWARTDAYKDKCDTIFASAIRGKKLQPGESCGEVSAVFFPETARAAVEEAALLFRKNSLNLPDGWQGLVVPGEEGKTRRRHLAVANLDGKVDQASLLLSFEEGAPLLSIPSFIRGKSGTTIVALNALETFGDTMDVYAEVTAESPVEARRIALGRYLFRPASGEKARVRLWFAGELGALEIVDSEGKILKEIVSSPQAQTEGVVFEIDREVVIIDKTEVDSDTIAPAVEIADIAIREDGRATLHIKVDDRSGIALVKVFMDGKEVAAITGAPWVWNVRPEKGYHTFYVTARDGSPRGNERTSTSRTIEVR
jgi:hypothetical protein